MNRNYLLEAVLLLIALPAAAHANAGTLLGMATIAHLLLGNLIIGIIEGSLLAGVFKVKGANAIPVMAVANYFSAWCGGWLCITFLSSLSLDIYSFSTMYWLTVLLAYIVTLLLEFPFVAYLFRGDSRWVQKAVKASLLIQTISYILLFGWYWMARETTFLDGVKPVPLASMDAPADVHIYYISEEDGDVYTQSLKGEAPSKVFDLNATQPEDRLTLQVSSTDSTIYDLVAWLDSNQQSTGNANPASPKLVTVHNSVLPVAMLPDYHKNGSKSFGKVPKLGDAQSSKWEFYCDFAPVLGLSARIPDSNKSVRVTMAAPFLSWQARNAIHLPTDKVLFQFYRNKKGSNQICLFDPTTGQLALIAKGRGPVAVLK